MGAAVKPVIGTTMIQIERHTNRGGCFAFSWTSLIVTLIWCFLLLIICILCESHKHVQRKGAGGGGRLFVVVVLQTLLSVMQLMLTSLSDSHLPGTAI